MAQRDPESCDPNGLIGVDFVYGFGATGGEYVFDLYCRGGCWWEWLESQSNSWLRNDSIELIRQTPEFVEVNWEYGGVEDKKKGEKTKNNKNKK